jgi:hypothetical protein
MTLEYYRLADWLRSRGREEVGVPGKSCDCPIVHWIRADFNTSWPQVEMDDNCVYITFLGSEELIEADRLSWLYWFICRVDCEPPMPIRADRVLEILEKYAT